MMKIRLNIFSVGNLQVHQFLVLTLALLDDVLLLKDLCQRDALLVQERVHVGHGAGVVLPEHLCQPDHEGASHGGVTQVSG